MKASLETLQNDHGKNAKGRSPYCYTDTSGLKCFGFLEFRFGKAPCGIMRSK